MIVRRWMFFLLSDLFFLNYNNFIRNFNYQIFLIIDPAILESITFFIPPLERRSQKSSGIISLSLEHVLKLRRDY